MLKIKLHFSLLYFIQGGILSYIMIFQKPYLNSIGISKDQIAILSSSLLIPFIIKIFFGTLSDKFGSKRFGHRLPYMFIGLLLSAVAFLLCSYFTPDKNFNLYFAFILMCSFAIALFDSATDGLAVDITPKSEQGSVQSFMIAGRAAGVILLSLGIGYISQNYGFSKLFLFLCALLIVPLISLYSLKDNRSVTEDFTADLSIVKNKEFLLTVAFAISSSFVCLGADGIISLYLSEVFSLTQTDIGSYGASRGVGAVVGALIAGIILQKSKTMGVFRFSLVFVFLGLTLLGFLLNQNNYLLIASVWGLIYSFQDVCLLTLAMRSITGSHSAFAFSLLMASANIGIAIGEGVATTLTQSYSYSNVFLILGCFLLIPYGLLRKLD
ncbi:MAG: MFS transporter [Bacteriovoracaceae bacterium]